MEIVIFGIAPNDIYESLLMDERVGISTIEQANKAIYMLENKYSCKNCRYHIVNMQEKPDFLGAVEISSQK